MTSFSIKEAISFGWNTFKARPWFFVAVLLIMMAVSMVTNMVHGSFEHAFGKGLGGLLSFAVSLVIDSFIGCGMIAVYLKAHDSVMSPTLAELWNPKPFVKYLGTSVLVGIIVIIGCILLIVPGIIAALALGFATILVVDKGLGPVEALKESARITKGNRLQLLGLAFALILVNLLGVLALFIGLFVSVPVSMLAMVHVYRHLMGVGVVPVASAPAPEPAPAPVAA